MLRIAGIIILMAPFMINAQDCYPLNSGNGLYLFSPFIMGTPHGVPQLKGASFGDYANSSCGGEPRKWSIAAYNFNGKAAAIFAAHSGIAYIYTTSSLTGEEGQAYDALWIDGDSITTSYMGIRTLISNGQYVYAGQLIGRVYTDVNKDNFGFGIRRAPVLNPVQKRGYLPTKTDDKNECSCNGNPLWPEYFVNPAAIRINYYAFNEVIPDVSLKIDILPGGIGKWSFDNGVTWLSSGDKVSGLPFGSYKIILKDEYGYSPPTPINIKTTYANKDFSARVSYTPDYTILKKPEALLQREADQEFMQSKLKVVADSLALALNSNNQLALRNNILDSLNNRFTRIEDIQKETFLFTRLFKYILPILLLALTFLIILFFQNTKIRRQKKHLENLQKEQHHRVHNSLGLVSSLLNKYKDNIDPEKLGNIDNNIIAISTVHRQLYKSSDLENINFQPVSENIAQSLLSQRGQQDEVAVSIDAGIMIPQKKSTILALMFNELLTNSLKYAFNGAHDKCITLMATLEKDHIMVVYKDSGTGYPSGFLEHKTSGFGRLLLDGLARQLRAKIHFYNENGACCMIKL